MYCTKCGKKIDYDSSICLECNLQLAASAKQANGASASTSSIVKPAPVSNTTETVTQGQGDAVKENKTVDIRPDTRSEGFSLALISMIFSCVNILVGSFFVAFLYADLIGVGLFFGSIYIALTVVSIIFGIKSIKTFKRVKREGNPLPVKTLIFGIIGLAMSAFLVYFFACYYFLMETGVFDLYLNLFI